MPTTIKEVCQTNSYKVAHSDYGIDYKTWLLFNPDIAKSRECSDEFKAMAEENIRKQEIEDKHKKFKQQQQYQEQKATSLMLKSIVEQVAKRSKFLTNE